MWPAYWPTYHGRRLIRREGASHPSPVPHNQVHTSSSDPTHSRPCCARAPAGEPLREVLLNAGAPRGRFHSHDAPRSPFRSRDAPRSRPAGPQRQAHADNVTSTTHYNFITFLPRFLFHSFSRLAYLYFLLQAALAWWPRVSPFNPWGSTLALAFVLLVSAVKEAAEDARRWRADVALNSRHARVRCDGAFRDARWRDVRVGDLLLVGDGEEVPADLLLLHSPAPGRTFVRTTNLDGEANLKARAPVRWHTGVEESAAAAAALCCRVSCEPPSASLRSFSGSMHVLDRVSGLTSPVTLALDNLLLRGCTLRVLGGGAVLGLVLYAGRETRIQLNARRQPSKSGAFDAFLNVQVALLVLLQFALCAGMAGGGTAWRSAHDQLWYMDWQEERDDWRLTGRTLLSFLTFWILFSFLVPISLFVTLELVAFLQGRLIAHDPQLAEPQTRERPFARNTNVNEDLGLIGFVFADKTGTLTANQMQLRALVLSDGASFGDASFRIESCTLPPPAAARAFDERLCAGDGALTIAAAEALVCIATAHDLLLEDGSYSGPSPDEVALAEGARALGVEFAGRDGRALLLRLHAADGAVVEQQLELLAALPFTSERQRMSVVVRRPDGRISLLCKGADSAMLPLLDDAGAALVGEGGAASASLSALASRGLRTLVLAARDLDLPEWLALLADPGGGAEWVRRTSVALETRLRFIGGTGLEDVLQDDVPQTLHALRKARIKVCVITGDKTQTALSIAVSIGLVASPHSSLRLLRAATPAAAAARLAELEAAAAAASGGYELVVDGASLSAVLSVEAGLSERFARLAAGARAVLACRTSPIQKAQLVLALQTQLSVGRGALSRLLLGRPAARTLAIGDGANDVPMLQAADVGVGLIGREGRQAAMSADYALHKFCHLHRLLFVHGTLSAYRQSRLIRYSFFKNICIGMLPLWLQLYAGYSGVALFDSVSAGLYNVVFTSLPILLFALMDRPLSDATLLAHPQLYGGASGGGTLSGRSFWKSFLDGSLASAAYFFLPLLAVQSSSLGLIAVGKIAYTAVLIVVTLEVLLVSHHITVLYVAVTLLSCALWLPLLYLIPQFSFVNELTGIAQELLPEPLFWLVLALCAVCFFVYRISTRAFRAVVAPTDATILREREKLGSVPQSRRRPAEAAAAP